MFGPQPPRGTNPGRTARTKAYSGSRECPAPVRTYSLPSSSMKSLCPASQSCTSYSTRSSTPIKLLTPYCVTGWTRSYHTAADFRNGCKRKFALDLAPGDALTSCLLSSHHKQLWLPETPVQRPGFSWTLGSILPGPYLVTLGVGPPTKMYNTPLLFFTNLSCSRRDRTERRGLLVMAGISL